MSSASIVTVCVCTSELANKPHLCLSIFFYLHGMECSTACMWGTWPMVNTKPSRDDCQLVYSLKACIPGPRSPCFDDIHHSERRQLSDTLCIDRSLCLLLQVQLLSLFCLGTFYIRETSRRHQIYVADGWSCKLCIWLTL